MACKHGLVLYRKGFLIGQFAQSMKWSKEVMIITMETKLELDWGPQQLGSK